MNKDSYPENKDEVSTIIPQKSKKTILQKRKYIIYI